MIEKGVKKSTITSYLTALRHHELSLGVVAPIQNSELTKKLLTGVENQQRNPALDAFKRQRRPVTGNILQMLGHAIAISVKSEFEKSLLWSVCLCAFWGSFRLSELLCTLRTQFNPNDSLMLSDLHIQDHSIGLWLRSEKVSNSLGNVVELWQLPDREDLDPVITLKSYLDRRSTVENSAHLPVFIHEDGSNLTLNEFNHELKELMNCYPEFAFSSRDFWAGHSFRSGLSTLLQSLGYNEDEIKVWGRWHSEAYMAYTKDMRARQKTYEKLTKTYGLILKKL